MKSATIVAAMLAAISSFPLIALQQAVPNQQRPSASQPAQSTTPAQTAPQQDQQAAPSQQANPAATAPPTYDLRAVKSELVSKLDTRSAKAGDSVVLKTKEDVKISDGTEIPKGSKLVGHVSAVQPRGDGKENSQIAIKFDHAELKGGHSLPILSVIQSVSGSETATAPDTTPGTGSFGTPSPNSAPANGSATAPGGGMNPNANPRQSSSMGAPGYDHGTGSSPATTNQGNVSGAGTIVSQQGNIAIRTTTIPGVLVANSVNGQPFSNASGLILGAKKDVELNSGTEVVVTVAAASTPSPSGGGAPNR